MWTCNVCKRIFQKTNQPHSCHKVPVQKHFKDKDKAKIIYDSLIQNINRKIGKCQIISIPCCVHLFGTYDFMAILPKKDRLEIRFSLSYKVESPRLKQHVFMSSKMVKNCIDLYSAKEIDSELIAWLSESYHLK